VSASPTPLLLDSTACDRCGRCVAVCKPRVLKIGPGYISVDWTGCDGCGTCATACDTGAIRLRRAPLRAVPAPLKPVARASAKNAAAGAAKAPAKRTREPGAAALAISRWSLPEAALVVVVALALLVGVQTFVAGTAGAPWTGIALVGYDAVLVALLWYLAQRRGLDPSMAYRLDGWPEWSALLLAPLVAIGCWLFSVTYRAVVLSLGLQPAATEGADLTRLFGPGVMGAVLTVVTVALLGPVIEEILLRGVVLGAVRERFGAWPAILVSALAFASLHASLWSLLPLAVLGIGLGWLATRSRSLWPAIAAHVLYNGVLVAAALYTAAR